MTPEPVASGDRLFTPEEANDLLPDVAPLAVRAQFLSRRHQRLLAEAESLGMEPGPEAEMLRLEVMRLVDQIHAHGVHIRGLASGLLDFPGVRCGRPVCLCWRVGEAEVGWWHPHGTGLRDRQCIDDDHPSVWAYYS